jgi:cell division protein FtsA
MAKKISVGIDIGTETTRVFVLEKNNDGLHPNVLGVGYSPTLGMRFGYIVNQKQVCQSLKMAIKDAEKKCGDIRIKKAYISIDGASLMSAYSVGSTIIGKADGEITHLDISKAIQNSEENLDIANRKIIEKIPTQYRLDGKVIAVRPDGMKGIKLESRTLYITCLKQNIEDLISVLAEVDIEPIEVIPGPVANANVVLSDTQKIAGSAVLDIGSETTSLVVYENNLPISIVVFPIGGTEITKHIAIACQTEIENAEKIKQGIIQPNIPKRRIDEIVDSRLTDIFLAVENHLKKIKKDRLLAGGIVILGNSAYLPKTEELARHNLKLPAKIGPSENSIGAQYKIQDLALYKSLGLAYSYTENKIQEEDHTNKGNIKQAKSFLKQILSQLLP